MLLRYELGDYAEAGAPCPCGRGLPVIRRIHGRVRNMLTYPDGRRSWVNFVRFKQHRAVAPVRQVQIVQTSLEHIELRIVSDEVLNSEQERRLAAMLLEDLNHPFEVSVSYHRELLRDERGKFEDFKSLVAGRA